MADIYQFIVNMLSLLATNPLCMLGFIIFIVVLVLVLVIHYIRKIRGEDIWLH